MRQIKEITSEPRQRHTITVTDQDPFTMLLEYRESQYGWFISITWGDRGIHNLRVTESENILRQWRNVIPFGLMVLTTTNQDPLMADDFSLGNASMYVLEADEVDTVEGDMYG